MRSAARPVIAVLLGLCALAFSSGAAADKPSSTRPASARMRSLERVNDAAAIQAEHAGSGAAGELGSRGGAKASPSSDAHSGRGAAKSAPSSKSGRGSGKSAPSSRSGRGGGKTTESAGKTTESAGKNAPSSSAKSGRDAAKGTRGSAKAAPSSNARKGHTAAKAKPAERPVSIGHPNEGRLQGAVRLDVSPRYVRPMAGSASDGALWGLPTLVGMVDRAARAVAKRYPGAVLGVGDISRRRGGEIAGHKSHESGRDVDLGFYVLDARGKPMQLKNFIPFDGSLRSASVRGARFDLARNWLLVERLLADPKARVTHIFVSEPLRRRLLEYARSLGAPGRVITRAAIAMMQPTRAMPHDDHFHVRIACPASMRKACVEIAKNAPRGRRTATVERKKHRRHVAAKRAARKKMAPQPRPEIASAKPDSPPALQAQSQAPEPEEAKPEASGATEAADIEAASDGEATSDGAEVKDAVDDSGTTKITD